MTNLTFVPRDPQDVDLAKKFTRACLKAGVFKEMKRRTFHEKPSLKKKRKKIEARKRERKAMRQRAEYDRRHSDE
jgi:small subunit ribosomal protein S21